MWLGKGFGKKTSWLKKGWQQFGRPVDLPPCRFFFVGGSCQSCWRILLFRVVSLIDRSDFLAPQNQAEEHFHLFLKRIHAVFLFEGFWKNESQEGFKRMQPGHHHEFLPPQNLWKNPRIQVGLPFFKGTAAVKFWRGDVAKKQHDFSFGNFFRIKDIQRLEEMNCYVYTSFSYFYQLQDFDSGQFWMTGPQCQFLICLWYVGDVPPFWTSIIGMYRGI